MPPRDNWIFQKRTEKLSQGPDVPDSKCTIGCRSPWPRYRLLTVLASYAELFPEVAFSPFISVILNRKMENLPHFLGAF